MINVKGLVKDFGEHRVVNHVSFEVDKGVVLGFLGPNGAGKSTTMRMVTGFVTPTLGTAEICGHDIITDPVAARRNIGYLPENAPAYGDMTVEEFLTFIARMRGYSGAEIGERVDRAVNQCFLNTVRHQTIETLSKGYRQRNCMAQAILHDPPILILDEPTDGLDPNQKQVVRDMIKEMAEEKVIIFSTHVLEEVDAVCNRAIIISEGEIVADSNPADLRKRSQSFNMVSVEVLARSDQVEAAFTAIPDVERVEMEMDGDHCRCRVTPREGQPVATQIIDAIRERGWLITQLETDNGRIDDVFRNLTITEDVGNKSA